LDDDKAVLGDVVLDTAPPDKLGVTLILALPRPKVLRRLVMDMTALGVNHIVLMNSYRTDKSYWGSPLLGRLDEFVLEGLQQGVDTVPPKITLAKRFKPFVQDSLPSIITQSSDKTPAKAVVCHPYADVGFGEMAVQGLPSVVIIGAEGGFIPYEIELLRSVGVQAVGLGKRILRTESAVNAVLGRWLL
ncbi:16S rRNA (uracil(1498)-N(3))-methyltransferase, partial [Moraxella caviae]